MAALHTLWLENSFPLVSGWATNLKFNLQPAQPARLGPAAGSVRPQRRGNAEHPRAVPPSGRGPNPALGLRLRRPAVLPLFSLRSLRSAHLPGPLGGWPGSRHRSRPLPLGRALRLAGPAPHRGPSPRTPAFRSSQRLLSKQASAAQAPLTSRPRRPHPLWTSLSPAPGEGAERTFLTIQGARGGASLWSPFTTACGCAAWLTAAPHRSRGGHSGDGVGLGVLGSVVQCGASVRDGPRMRLPGRGSGLGGPPCGRAREPRSSPRGVVRLRLRLVAAARPLDTVESARSAAGAPARGPRRGIASCCSSWGRLAAAVTVSPRIRR